MATQFDPIDYAQQLEAAGVPKAQAEVHARTLGHLVGNCVALPSDLVRLDHNLRREIKALEERINAKFEALEQRLTARMDIFEAKIIGQITQLRWMLGTVVATNIAIVVKLFVP